MSYHVFARNFWKRNPEWPGGREPHLGRKTTLCYVQTEAEARRACMEYNADNDPGFLSRKAEYEGA
jgi:hypothetical protein